VNGGAPGRRPCSAPAAGFPGGVPSSALQRGKRALARRRRPQRTPQLEGVTARRRGRLWCVRPSPLLCARSRFPGRGSELGAAAGRKGLGAPPPTAADPQTRRGHRSAARPTAVLPAVAPALYVHRASRPRLLVCYCSGGSSFSGALGGGTTLLDPLGEHSAAPRHIVALALSTRVAPRRPATGSGLVGSTAVVVGPPSRLRHAGGHFNRRTFMWSAAGCGTTSRRRGHCTRPARPTSLLARLRRGPRRECYRYWGTEIGAHSWQRRWSRGDEWRICVLHAAGHLHVASLLFLHRSGHALHATERRREPPRLGGQGRGRRLWRPSALYLKGP